MMDLKQLATPFSSPYTPIDGIPLATAKNPLGMSMGTSRFAAGIPKNSTSATLAISKAEAPKPNWKRELDFSGNAKTSPPGKKGRVRQNKQKTPRAQAPTRKSGPSNPATSTALSPVAPAVVTAPATPSGSPTNAASLRPTAPVFVPHKAASIVTTPPIMSAPYSPSRSADSGEPPADKWKENSKVQKEHIVYLQRLSKEGLKKDEIAERTAAEFPELCKGMRNGCRTATEETRLEAVGDAVFMHTRRYAVWYV